MRVPEVRVISPRIRCYYCFRNKPKSNRRRKSKKQKDIWCQAEGRLIPGSLKRNLEDHVLTRFHSEGFKKEAALILAKRNKKKNGGKKQLKQPELPTGFLYSRGKVEDNLLRNFIRSCAIGAHVKSSPRQTFAHIAGAALADGLQAPIYGYNNRSERSIVHMQIFTSFILRANLMDSINNARVLGLFSDAEHYRQDKLLMFGVHIVYNGYCCPLPLCFSFGGTTVTGQLIRDSLIHGVTADNIFNGGSQMIPELAVNLKDEDVLESLSKIKRLNEYTPIGTTYEMFIKKIANSLTDGDSKYLKRFLTLLRSDQKEALGGHESLVSVKGTWCLNHCAKLGADDLRQYSSFVDRAIKLIIKVRSFIHQSTTRSSRLKVACKNMGLKYAIIPD